MRVSAGGDEDVDDLVVLLDTAPARGLAAVVLLVDVRAALTSACTMVVWPA